MAADDSDWSSFTTEQLQFKEIQDLNARKRQLKTGYSAYLYLHPEVKTVVSKFMTAALLEKPENVFEFARKHFVGDDPGFFPQDIRELAPLILLGPGGVGKRTLMSRLQKCGLLSSLFFLFPFNFLTLFLAGS